MTKHVPEFTTLDIAKKRLQSFMDSFNATLKECAIILGWRDERDLKLMLKAEGDHPDAAMVMSAFGIDNVPFAEAKLLEMRGGVLPKVKSKTTPTLDIKENVMSDQKETSETSRATVAELARRLHKEFRTGQGRKLTNANAAAMMNKNKPATVTRVFNDKALSVGLSPSGLETLKYEYAIDILKALAACHWPGGLPKELMPYQPAAPHYADPRVKGKAERSHKKSYADPRVTAQQTADTDEKETGGDDIGFEDAETANVSEEEAYFPSEDSMREVLSNHFKTQTGYDISEIKDSHKEIDLILVARRSGFKVRVLVDTLC